MVPVGLNRSPVLDAGNRYRLAQYRQFLFAFQIIANVVVEDTAAVMSRIRVANEDRDRDRCAGALTRRP